MNFAELAETFGTPLYVFDGAAFVEHISEVAGAFRRRGIQLYYSVKANPSVRIATGCVAAGIGLDLCSPGDVRVAELAGASRDNSSYTGIGLSEEELRLAHRSASRVNLDSAQEVRRYAAIFPGEPVGLRVAVDHVADVGFAPAVSSHGWGGKFGEDPIKAECLAAEIATDGSRLVRLHTHIGSGVDRVEPYIVALRQLLGIARRIESVEEINLGGGLAGPLLATDAPFPLDELLDRAAEEVERFVADADRRLTLAFEPGDYLVGRFGWLLTTVRVVKEWVSEHATRSVAVVDGSMNLLPAHALYGMELEIVHVARSPRLHEPPRRPYDVVGNLNQEGDRLATQRELPVLSSDDLLVFGQAGSYARCRSTQFNGRVRPAVIWVESGETSIEQPAETIDDLPWLRPGCR